MISERVLASAIAHCTSSIIQTSVGVAMEEMAEWMRMKWYTFSQMFSLAHHSFFLISLSPFIPSPSHCPLISPLLAFSITVVLCVMKTQTHLQRYLFQEKLKVVQGRHELITLTVIPPVQWQRQA